MFQTGFGYKNQIIHPVSQCHYCNRSDIETSGVRCRLSPDDEQKTWFCSECCANMQKHEYGINTMDNDLYLEILKKCYTKIYEMRYGEKLKEKSTSQTQTQTSGKKKKNKSTDKNFAYKEKNVKKKKKTEKKSVDSETIERDQSFPADRETGDANRRFLAKLSEEIKDFQMTETTGGNRSFLDDIEFLIDVQKPQEDFLHLSDSSESSDDDKL
jgi:hypothetical protein